MGMHIVSLTPAGTQSIQGAPSLDRLDRIRILSSYPNRRTES